MSQDEQILDYLKRGGSLTPKDAREKFGCDRLASRAYALRKRGFNVVSRMVEVSDQKHVAEYSIQ
jgi:hypothetical protein